MEIERRSYSCGDIETREDGGKRVIRGHAAMFNVFSEPMWGFVERIAPGAFAESLSGDVRALWSHNLDLVLGRTLNGTLVLSEDAVGLAFELELPDTTLGRDAFVSIKRGDVTGMSFGFSVKKDSWEVGEEGKPDIRTLEKIRLYEVSPTAFPAYPQTDVSVRSLQAIAHEGRTVLRRGAATALARQKLALLEY